MYYLYFGSIFSKWNFGFPILFQNFIFMTQKIYFEFPFLKYIFFNFWFSILVWKTILEFKKIIGYRIELIRCRKQNLFLVCYLLTQNDKSPTLTFLTFIVKSTEALNKGQSFRLCLDWGGDLWGGEGVDLWGLKRMCEDMWDWIEGW